MSAHQRVSVSLTAWIDNLVQSGADEELGRVAAVLCDFAGRFSWLAELEDAAGRVSFSESECERQKEAGLGLPDFGEGGDAVFDAISDRIEGEQLALALQQLSDMGATRIVLEPPGDDGRWHGSFTAPTGHVQQISEPEGHGAHVLMQRMAMALGGYLKDVGRGRLDS